MAEPPNDAWSKCGSTLYDCIAIFVSLADLTTDIIVLIQFYNLNRMNFFATSLTILLIAQFAYCIAFTIRYSNYSDSLCIRFCTLLCCIPFAPFLSIVFYFASSEQNKSNWLQEFMENTLNLYVDGYYIDNKKSKYIIWIEIKLYKHFGFILEAFVEALPQSILQMIAIVYYQEANSIAILSILLSMLSVSSKSLIFSRSIDNITFIFNWLCCVCDFYSIFYFISWVFYNPHNKQVFEFTVIGWLWISKLLIGLGPALIFGLLCGFIFGIVILIMYLKYYITEKFTSKKTRYDERIKEERMRIWRQRELQQQQQQQQQNAIPVNNTNNSNEIRPLQNAQIMNQALRHNFINAPIKAPCHWIILKIIYIFFLFIGGICLLCIGISVIAAFSSMMLEIFCYSYIFLFLYALIASRFPHENRASHEFWLGVFRFLLEKRRDRLLRVIVINRILEGGKCNYTSFKFRDYLDMEQNKCTKKPFQDVTYHTMKIHTDELHTMFCEVVKIAYMAIINEFKEELKIKIESLMNIPPNVAREDYEFDIQILKLKIFGLKITFYGLIPIYLMSRVLTLIFPFLVIGYIGYHDLWQQIDLFQYVMSGVYMLFLLTLFFLGIWRVFPLHHALWHIVPGRSQVIVDSRRYDQVFELLDKYYIEVNAMPVRNELVYKLLGPDVAELVLSYLPPFDAVLPEDANDEELNQNSEWVVGAGGPQKRVIRK